MDESDSTTIVEQQEDGGKDIDVRSVSNKVFGSVVGALYSAASCIIGTIGGGVGCSGKGRNGATGGIGKLVVCPKDTFLKYVVK